MRYKERSHAGQFIDHKSSHEYKKIPNQTSIPALFRRKSRKYKYHEESNGHYRQSPKRHREFSWQAGQCPIKTGGASFGVIGGIPKTT